MRGFVVTAWIVTVRARLADMDGTDIVLKCRRCVSCDSRGAANDFHEASHALVQRQPQTALANVLSAEQRVGALKTSLEVTQDAVERRPEEITTHLLRIHHLILDPELGQAHHDIA